MTLSATSVAPKRAAFVEFSSGRANTGTITSRAGLNSL